MRFGSLDRADLLDLILYCEDEALQEDLRVDLQEICWPSARAEAQ